MIEDHSNYKTVLIQLLLHYEEREGLRWPRRVEKRNSKISLLVSLPFVGLVAGVLMGIIIKSFLVGIISFFVARVIAMNIAENKKQREKEKY